MLENILLAIVLALVNAGEYFVGYCLSINKPGDYLVVHFLAIS